MLLGPSELPEFFEHDYFGVGVKARDVPLRALTIEMEVSYTPWPT
jgi:hypothetical protein